MADEKPSGIPPVQDLTEQSTKPKPASDQRSDVHTKPDHTHTIDPVKFQTELVQRLAKIINQMKERGITVPPQLIEQFKQGVSSLIAAQAKPIQK